MSAKMSSFSIKQASRMTLLRVAIIITGLSIMAACGGSSSSTTTTTTTPGVGLSAASLTFSNTVNGTQTMMVTVTDNGTASDTFTGFAISGTNAADFTQSNTCGTGIAAGATCTVSVTFSSSTAGSGLTATLTITDNAGTQTVALAGTATAPTPAVTPSATSLTFATGVGVTSLPQIVTLTDTGTGAVTFTSLSITGTNASDFSETNTCAAGIAVNATCSVNVTFTSSTGGTFNADLTLVDNAGTQTVTLSGTAATPMASASPASLTYITQSVGTTSASQAATLSNPGTVPLAITSIAITGTNLGDFSQTNNCGASLSASASCTINVSFTPTATGTRTAAVTITDDATPATQSVTLTGTGATPSVTLSANTLTYASTSVGTSASPQSVMLTNGSVALTISSIAVTSGSANFTQTNTCGTGVAANGTCSISVTFTPSTTGALTGTVTITDNAGDVTGSTQTISLSGTGTTPPVNNTAQLSVSLGLEGNYVNNITTSVTVCVPNTTTCTTIPDVLVDTGSVGLRLLSSGADNVTGAQVGSLGLPTITDSSTNFPLYECVEYGDLSYTWGPMAYATVTVGGETGTQVPAVDGGVTNGGIPIQIITNETPPEAIAYEGVAYYNPCIYNNGDGAGPNAGTVASLGSNGILGIGNFPQDCALAQNYCTDINSTTGQYLEYSSAGVSTSNDGTLNYVVEATPLNYQAWNPVSTFPTDNTGSIITLPSVGATGSAPLTGTLTFGIGTETDNAITTQSVYELDCGGDFLSVTYNGVTYDDVDNQTDCSSETSMFIDSGSNAFYILDETTLGSSSTNGASMNDCIASGSDLGWYCPLATGTTTAEPFDMMPLTLTGDNGTQTNVSLVLGNYDTLNATGNAAFNNIAESSCEGGASAGCTALTDFFDFGLPFFFGRPIYIGISEGLTYPNGYWAF